ncbi:hypothetical protein HSX11_14285 [Oxalobacteraceae bacterium]|nr:hypothetical protein [Oxalobacteraceae bacterium]
MKRVMLCVLAGTLALGVQAQTSDEQHTVRVPGQSLRIDVPEQGLHKWATNFDVYQGAYELSNGQILSLTSRGQRMYAELDDGEKMELVAASRNVFVASNKLLKMSLERQIDGEVKGELLIAKPALPAQVADTAGLSWTVATLARR